MQILEEKENNHGQVILKFGEFQKQLEPEIGIKAWKKSGLIENYDGSDDSIDAESDLIIDDDETPNSSQIMANDFLALNLNNSQYEESVSQNKKLKQSSISTYFFKK